MEIIINNPFRILGIYAGAKTALVNKNFNRLKMFVDVDQEIPDELSLAVFPCLGPLKRAKENIEYASSHLNLDQDKMLAALFWFYEGNAITDEPAFDELRESNIQGALNIWKKLVERGEVTERNFSAFQNISTLYLLRAFKGSFPDSALLTSAIKLKLQFLESDFALKYKAVVTDTTFKISKDDLQLLFLHEIESEIQKNKKYKESDLIDILGNIDFKAKPEFLKGFVQKPIAQIEKKIEEAKTKRKANTANAAKAGQELFTSTADDLEQLKSILGSNDLKYMSVADKVANEILQCSIDYFNDSQEKDSSSDYSETALKMANQAETIAIGKLTKDRVKDSIETLALMKDKEISQAIQVLQSIKDAYETNKSKINTEVLEMPLGTNQSINWGKVNQMIENSLEWDKVVELIQEIIPAKNIDKIKNVKDVKKENEYKGLVDFLMSKLSRSNKDKIKYICFWKDEIDTKPSPVPAISKPKTKFRFLDNAWWIMGIAGLGLGLWAGYEWGILGTIILGAFIGLYLDEWESNLFMLLFLFGITGFIVYNRLDEFQEIKEKQVELKKEQDYLSGWDSSIDRVLKNFLNKKLSINNKNFNKNITNDNMILYLAKVSNTENNVIENFTLPNCKIDALISNGYNSSFDTKDLKYIIIEDFESEEAGKYDDGSRGYIHVYNLYIIDFVKKKIVEHKVFKGGDPPFMKKGAGHEYGERPTAEFNSYLQELFNISYLSCTY